MKLWIKLALIIIVITNVIIEISLFFIRPEIRNHSIELIGQKLKSIAAASAANIDGDEFEKLNFSNPQISKSPKFEMIKDRLLRVKKNLDIKEDIYTFNVIGADKVVFGAVTNRDPFTGDTLILSSVIPKTAVNSAYEHNECVYTDIYNNSYGSWLSGIAPILNSKNMVVGIVQVDNSISTVETMMSGIENYILWVRLLLIPLTIMLSIILARFFTKPIQEVVNRINKISSGDYSENKPGKFNGEIGELYSAAENLRSTILEQQDKIFKSVSELKTAKENAEASDKMKSEFLAVISHEIRTPLNVILGSLEVAKLELNGKELEELEELVSEIKIGSKRLIRTVEMIALYSELAANGYTLNQNFININKIFFDLVEPYKYEAEQKGITLRTDCTATTGMVKADARLIEEALKQIIDNAVKYTQKGEIKFCIANNNDDGIVLVIEDTGIGISEEFKKELYKPFRQEDMSYSRSYEGNGLGLALAKKSLNANGFDLQLSSEKKKGTTVLITIPNERLFNIN